MLEEKRRQTNYKLLLPSPQHYSPLALPSLQPIPVLKAKLLDQELLDRKEQGGSSSERVQTIPACESSQNPGSCAQLTGSSEAQHYLVQSPLVLGSRRLLGCS